MPHRLINSQVALASAEVATALAAHADPKTTYNASELVAARADLALARGQLAASRQTLLEATRAVAQLREDLVAAHQAGDLAAVAQLEAQLSAAMLDRAAKANALQLADEHLGEVHHDIATDIGTASAYLQLEDQAPVALLPVRLETRYFTLPGDEDNFSLWVRIFPDDIHVDDVQPLPSSSERAAAEAYWQARLAHGHDSAEALAAWQTLRARVGEGRATRLVAALDPFGRAGAYDPADDPASAPPLPAMETAPAGWLDPARAKCLPDRWTITGYRGEERVLLAFTSPVRPDLRMTPELGEPGEELAGTAQGSAQVDAGIEWLTDFDAAVEAGMAARITVNKTIARSMDKLVVFGVRATEDAATSASALSELLEAHASKSLHFVRPHSPTNNTDTARSDYNPRSADPSESHARLLESAASSHSQSFQSRTSKALGLDSALFQHARHAGDLRERQVKAMHTALWPTTVGALLQDHVEAQVHPDDIAFVRSVFVDQVRPDGHLPCMRIGPQPYGLLPMVSLDRWASQTGDSSETILVNLLRSVRDAVRPSVDALPRLYDAVDPQRALVDVLSLAPAGGVTEGRFSTWQPVERALEMEQRMGPWWAEVLPLLELDKVDLLATHGGTSLSERQSPSLGHVEQTVDLAAPMVSDQDDVLAPLEANYIAELVDVRPPPSVVTTFAVTGAAEGPLLYRLLGGAYLFYMYNQYDPFYPYFFGALSTLKDLDVETLQTLCTGVVDSGTHRVDTWVGAVAGRRLDEVRASQPTGVHLGGFGWVEGLQPPGTPPEAGSAVVDDPDSAGYLHLPSARQARTAAILHGAHLAHADQGSAETLSMQLDSDRVRLGRWLLEGMREGQPLGALLGYRIERQLLDDGQAQWIQELRQALPMRVSEDGLPGDDLATLNVVDGLQVLRLEEAGQLEDALGAWLFAEVQPSLSSAAVALDAVSDLLLAEGVHHAAEGNAHRAGAAFDALSEGHGAVPELDLVATPSPGQSMEHRVLVVLPASHTASWAGDSGRARAVAEPRLNAWAAALLGAPEQLHFSAVFHEDGQDTEQGFTLADLDLCALDLVHLSGASLGQSALAACLQLLLEQQGPSGAGGFTGAVTLRGADPAAPDSAQSLDEALALAHELRGVLRAARPLDAAQLRSSSRDSSTGVDLAELGARAAAVSGMVDAIAADVESDPTDLAAWWRAALLVGAVDLRTASGVEGLNAELDGRRAQRDALDPIDATAAARIQALLGQDFTVLPSFSAGDAGALDACLADQATLLTGDGTAPKRWLEDQARVRPACDALDLALTLAELCGAPASLGVAQLPYQPGAAWIGESLPPQGVSARVSLVAHLPFAATLAGEPLAGLVVDSWAEVVPDPTTVTGVSFHYDAPKARAPQAILLALPPNPSQGWRFEDIEATVLETLELAKLRGLESRHLPEQGLYLPAVFLINEMDEDPPT